MILDEVNQIGWVEYKLSSLSSPYNDKYLIFDQIWLLKRSIKRFKSRFPDKFLAIYNAGDLNPRILNIYRIKFDLVLTEEYFSMHWIHYLGKAARNLEQAYQYGILDKTILTFGMGHSSSVNFIIDPSKSLNTNKSHIDDIFN